MNVQTNEQASPSMGGGEAVRAARQAIWRAAAENLGWEWSPAYDGYVRADHHPGGHAGSWSSYPSDLSAEDACFVDGVESIEQALETIDAAAYRAH